MPTITAMNAETSEKHEHIAVYAGSFDPITYGHLDVLNRSRHLFDRIVLGIGINPEKPSLFNLKQRVEMATGLVSDMLAVNPDGAQVTVDSYNGLTVDFARDCDASAPVVDAARDRSKRAP